MASIGRMTFDVQTRLTISEEMAERCLRLLEMYLTDNPNKRILETEGREGRRQLEIVTPTEAEWEAIYAHLDGTANGEGEKK